MPWYFTWYLKLAAVEGLMYDRCGYDGDDIIITIIINIIIKSDPINHIVLKFITPAYDDTEKHSI